MYAVDAKDLRSVTVSRTHPGYLEVIKGDHYDNVLLIKSAIKLVYSSDVPDRIDAHHAKSLIVSIDERGRLILDSGFNKGEIHKFLDDYDFHYNSDRQQLVKRTVCRKVQALYGDLHKSSVSS